MTKRNSESAANGKWGAGKIALLIGALAALITSITPGVLAFLEGAGEKAESSYEILSVEINAMKQQQQQSVEDMREMREWIYSLAVSKRPKSHPPVPEVSVEAPSAPVRGRASGSRAPRPGSAAAARSAVSADPLAGLGLGGGGGTAKPDKGSAEAIVKAVEEKKVVEQKEAKQAPIQQQALPTSLGAAIKSRKKGKGK